MTEQRPRARRDSLILGGILVAVGAWLLFDRYVDVDIDTSWFVPGAFVVLGIALVVVAVARSRDAA
jgi:hypothetical protein